MEKTGDDGEALVGAAWAVEAKWDPVASVDPPQPSLVPLEALPHPFDAPSRLQVVVFALLLGIIVVLAAVGLWRIACWCLVALLTGAAAFRLSNRRAWTRSRGRVFDVVALLGVALALGITLLSLPL